jgi:hypothetical protein
MKVKINFYFLIITWLFSMVANADCDPMPSKEQARLRLHLVCQEEHSKCIKLNDQKGDKYFVDPKTTYLVILSAKVISTEFGLDIKVNLDEVSGCWLKKLTTDNLNEKLAIVHGGNILVAPIISAPIPNGKFIIDMGRKITIDKALALCKSILGTDCKIEDQDGGFVNFIKDLLKEEPRSVLDNKDSETKIPIGWVVLISFVLLLCLVFIKLMPKLKSLLITSKCKTAFNTKGVEPNRSPNEIESELLPNSIFMDILLTFITLGIWNIWVQIRQVDAVNQLAKEKVFKPMLVIFLLSIFTFGLYFCYHEFKMTRTLHKLKNGKINTLIELCTGFIYIPYIWVITDSYQQSMINELTQIDEKVLVKNTIKLTD